MGQVKNFYTAREIYTRFFTIKSSNGKSGLNLQLPKAYLATTAKRLVIDQSRRQCIERAYLAELKLATAMMDHAPSPEQLLSVMQVLERISVALEGLARKPQQAFLLHYLEGKTHAAIAGQLGVSDRMVRKYLVQALVHCYQACDPTE